MTILSFRLFIALNSVTLDRDNNNIVRDIIHIICNNVTMSH